ncbi:hypothetical protein [Clostridium moutaii]
MESTCLKELIQDIAVLKFSFEKDEALAMIIMEKTKFLKNIYDYL